MKKENKAKWVEERKCEERKGILFSSRLAVFQIYLWIGVQIPMSKNLLSDGALPRPPSSQSQRFPILDWKEITFIDNQN